MLRTKLSYPIAAHIAKEEKIVPYLWSSFFFFFLKRNTVKEGTERHLIISLGHFSSSHPRLIQEIRIGFDNTVFPRRLLINLLHLYCGHSHYIRWESQPLVQVEISFSIRCESVSPIPFQLQFGRDSHASPSLSPSRLWTSSPISSRHLLRQSCASCFDSKLMQFFTS